MASINNLDKTTKTANPQPDDVFMVPLTRNAIYKMTVELTEQKKRHEQALTNDNMVEKKRKRHQSELDQINALLDCLTKAELQ